MGVLGRVWHGELVWIQILLLVFSPGIRVWEQLDWRKEANVLGDAYSLMGQGDVSLLGQWIRAAAITKVLLASSREVRDGRCTSWTKATLPALGSAP